MSQQKSNTSAGNGAPLIIDGGIGGVTITGGPGGVHGDGGAVNLKAGDGGNVNEESQNSKHIAEQKAEPVPDHWYKKPVGVIGLAIVSGILVFLTVYLIRTHFGLQ